MHWVIGMMGTGKSTAASLAAAELALPFYDTDDLIVELAGTSIVEMWQSSGEEAFRELERQVVADLGKGSGITATGGGAAMDAASAAVMREGESVVWLTCDLPEVLRRLEGDDRRPLLGADPEDTLTRLISEREAAYSEIATIEIDTTDSSPQDVANELVRRWSD